MSVPGLLFLMSLAGVAVALSLPEMRDLILLAGPSAFASLWIWIGEWFGRGRTTARRVVLDGSNVMYWLGNAPRVSTVVEVLSELNRRGFAPSVLFDANAGYLLGDRYMDDRTFAHLLGLPDRNVRVVPKGTPADPYILAAARKLGARIVSNDRFRDWAEDHPEVADKGHLIRGGYRDGKLWLDLEEAKAALAVQGAA